MRLRPLYALGRAVDALRRGPLLAAVATGTLFVAVLVTGLFAATLRGAERLVEAWGGEVSISVYLRAGADLEAARAAASAMAPGLAVEAVTPAQALARLRVSLGRDAGALDGVEAAVLPASVEIRAPARSAAAVRQLAARLVAIPGAAEVDSGSAFLDTLERLLSRVRVAGGALLAFLALATAILVANTLRLAIHARRDEIEIMKLVGATDAFVRAPFLVEGFLQGVAGAGLAVATLFGAWAVAAPRLRAVAPIVAELRRPDVLPASLLVALLAGGTLLGVAASALAAARLSRGR